MGSMGDTHGRFPGYTSSALFGACSPFYTDIYNRLLVAKPTLEADFLQNNAEAMLESRMTKVALAKVGEALQSLCARR